MSEQQWTAQKLMEKLIGKERMQTQTVDTCKRGDPDRIVRKVGTCLTPTADVLRACRAWGADLLITHEPCVYDHLDNPREDPVTDAKRALLDTCDFVIWRFHDYIHAGDGPDGIHTGFLNKLGLKGQYDGSRYFMPDEPITALELAKKAEEAGLTLHARIAGKRDVPAKKVMLFLGACGGAVDAFLHDDAQLAVLGEVCEWRNVEQMRDAEQFGIDKSYVVLGHGASEFPGMEQLADRIRAEFPPLEVRYFHCGDIYTYTDSE